MDTIFALASARGKAGVAVIRLSGPASWTAGQRLAGDLPPPRVASLRHLTDASGGYLDQALVLCFEKGHSFTGEDVLEFQLHGSVATVSAVLDTLARLPDLRLAEPGEFTRRALENGCLDLAQVEGLSDLIEAETEAQRKQALRVFQGDLGKLAETWRRDLVRALSLLEATIDFADEEIPPNLMAEVQVLLAETRASLQAETDRTRIAERIRDGFEVAIIGPPNIGKSSLLNRLAGRQAAITSEVAGTTRDVIEVHMDLGGLPVTILDTAGIRETSDTVESLGVARAHSRAELADIRVFLVEPGAVGVSGVTKVPGDIVVVGKSDLHKNNNALAISSVTGEGISALVDLVTSTLQDRASGAGTATRLRHRLAMGSAISLLGSAQTALQTTPDATELVSSDIYLAIRALDSLIGRVDVEHILDEIFASFCLGK